MLSMHLSKQSTRLKDVLDTYILQPGRLLAYMHENIPYKAACAI